MGGSFLTAEPTMVNENPNHLRGSKKKIKLKKKKIRGYQPGCGRSWKSHHARRGSSRAQREKVSCSGYTRRNDRAVWVQGIKSPKKTTVAGECFRKKQLDPMLGEVSEVKKKKPYLYQVEA